MGRWPALYRPSSGSVTGWMMQIKDNINAILNGITPNLMSLKGWALALLSGGGGLGCFGLTDTQIKCSDREHNKVIRECDMSVRGGWRDELSLSVRAHPLAYPWCPINHRGKTGQHGRFRQIFMQVEDKSIHSSFPVHHMFVNLLPAEE